MLYKRIKATVVNSMTIWDNYQYIWHIIQTVTPQIFTHCKPSELFGEKLISVKISCNLPEVISAVQAVTRSNAVKRSNFLNAGTHSFVDAAAEHE